MDALSAKCADLVLSILVCLGAPPLLNSAFLGTLAESSALETDASFPPPRFIRARSEEKSSHGQLPQIIAHRGYNTKFPENSMAAFRGAIEAGAHALETDVRLTRDGVVVLSHDPTLMRCFGVEKKISDCDWEYISGLQTLKEPHESMPRLLDLIEFLAQPDAASIWLQLDIKPDINADEMMSRIAAVFKQVPESPGSPWKERVVLGFWAAKYVPLCQKHLPGFPLVNITFSVAYAEQFLAMDNISFVMMQATLLSPRGRNFIKRAKVAGRQVISWTVNDEYDLDWVVKRKLDGVITDDPKRFVDLMDPSNGKAISASRPLSKIPGLVRINFLVSTFSWLFGWKHGYGIERRFPLFSSRVKTS
ncbi:Hypothetical protein R9X50_00189700 [Acrodontium crateriforme]|uniref:GP-PDE domain-containing protein n=1 Tax=Acrodontium crateriforme TaxID=150365 RepID=A0AAQ3LZY3_9PEZI|nr:Hypothetical protein R9X50_00189700 [Acrodontium crateriforme]